MTAWHAVALFCGAGSFTLVGSCAQEEPSQVADDMSDGGVNLLSAFDMETWEKLRALSPAVLPPPPLDPTNQVADEPRARLLGRSLFFDPGFSGKLLDSDNDGSHGGVGLQGEAGKVSCASCHDPEAGLSDFRTHEPRISLAAGWTRRRTPSIFDVGHTKLLMWDGRFDTLHRQALAVFESPLEGNSSRLFVAQEIARRYASEYEAVFGESPADVLREDYPQLDPQSTGCSLPLDGTTTPDEQCTGGELHGVPGDGAEYDGLTSEQKARVTHIALNAGRAIAAYERQFSCGQSRFDLFMAGSENAMTASEKRGARLFVGEGGCVSCHSGPFMSDQAFHNVGVRAQEIPGVGRAGFEDEGALSGIKQLLDDPLNSHAIAELDDGRVPATLEPKMLGAFRTPMLRCVAERPSYMHAGNLETLEDVVAFFNRGGHAVDGPEGLLGTSEIEPLGLTAQDEKDLVAFLRALSAISPLDRALLPSSTAED